MNVIKIQGVRKSFATSPRQRKTVLHNLELTVRRGEVFGFLGPNGAGKSTTIKLLLNFIRPDSGNLHILGNEVGKDEFRHQLGYLSEFPSFYPQITAYETLDFVGRLSGMAPPKIKEQADYLLNRVNLAQATDQQISSFSKGMKQRLGLAVALIHSPEVLIFDEPMSGLDPVGRHLVKGIISELREQGKTVFFSSHILSDIEDLCDNIGIIHQGHLLYQGPLKEFRQDNHLEKAFIDRIEEWDRANLE